MEKILLVDDDHHLLAACRRHLRRHFAVETAPNAEAGLAAVEQRGPFAVVVSDLRMTGTDGIKFLSQVRTCAPDTVRMLFTGFPEIQTAIQAVNDGYIFRFLNKPCPPEVLACALRDGVRQYNLITTRHQFLEARLRHAQKLGLLGQCAAGAAHDLNNILTVIQTGTRLVLQGEAQPQGLKQLLSQVEQAAQRASKLTQQMVGFSRRREAAHFQPVRIDELLADLNALVSPLLGLNFTLQIEVSENLPPVRGDEDLLAQIFMNLVTNARDAMPGGGVIRVAATVPDGLQSRGSDASGGHFVRLSVTDDGCGMDARTQARIFEPFFTTKETGKGTGLGLSIVSEAVQSHGGWVDVQSEPRRGTTFNVSLPQWEPTRGKASARPLRSGTSRGPQP